MEEKYGKVVYEITNEQIVNTKNKRFKTDIKLAAVSFIFSTVFGLLLLAGVVSIDEPNINRNIGLVLIGLAVFAGASIVVRKNKQTKKDNSDFCTCIYENGFVFDQGKHLEIGFDEIDTITRERRRQALAPYKIDISTKGENKKGKTIIIGEYGIPISTDINELYTELRNAFDNYQVRIQNENNIEL